MAIEELLIDSADAARVAPAVRENPAALVASAVSENLADPAELAELENLAELAESVELENLAVPAALENLAVLAELENPAVPAELVSLVDLVVAVDQARGRRVALRVVAAVVPIVSVVVNLRWAAAEERSAAAAQTTLGPVAVEEVPAWAAAVSAVAVAAEEAAAEAVAVAVAVAAVVVAVAAAVAAVAGDEQSSNGIKIYEIEIKHYELIKNFTPCVCNRCGGVFIAGRAGG